MPWWLNLENLLKKDRPKRWRWSNRCKRWVYCRTKSWWRGKTDTKILLCFVVLWARSRWLRRKKAENEEQNIFVLQIPFIWYITKVRYMVTKTTKLKLRGKTPAACSAWLLLGFWGFIRTGWEDGIPETAGRHGAVSAWQTQWCHQPVGAGRGKGQTNTRGWWWQLKQV